MSARRHSIKVAVVALITAICVGEVVIMFLLDRFGPFTPIVEAVIDSVLLVAIVLPVVIAAIYKPMSRNLDLLIDSEFLVKEDERIIREDDIEREALLDQLDHAAAKISARESQMLALLNSLALAKDHETGGHVIRTQKYLTILALRLREMGHFPKALEGGRIEILSKVAPLHDIGKMGVPDAVLKKAGALTDDERRTIEAHTLIGESILSAAEFDNFVDGGLISTAIKVAGGHHERWNGSGYPRGLVGEAIPAEARIMAVADVYDALVSRRPYKRQWTHQETVAEIISKKGILFDPLVVDAFLLEEANFLKVAAESHA